MADARQGEEAHQNDGQEAEDEQERIEQQARTLSGFLPTSRTRLCRATLGKARE